MISLEVWQQHAQIHTPNHHIPCDLKLVRENNYTEGPTTIRLEFIVVLTHNFSLHVKLAFTCSTALVLMHIFTVLYVSTCILFKFFSNSSTNKAKQIDCSKFQPSVFTSDDNGVMVTDEVKEMDYSLESFPCKVIMMLMLKQLLYVNITLHQKQLTLHSIRNKRASDKRWVKPITEEKSCSMRLEEEEIKYCGICFIWRIVRIDQRGKEKTPKDHPDDFESREKPTGDGHLERNHGIE